jgi:uncharacterized membrane protein (Fun14 family)
MNCMRCIIAIGSYTVVILSMCYYGYVNINTDKYNYECKKGKLFKSATPDSYVFIKTLSECFDIRDEPLIKEVKNANKH